MKNLKSIFNIITIVAVLFSVNTFANNNTKKNSSSFSFHQDEMSKKLILNSKKIDYTVEIFNEEGDLIQQVILKKNTSLEVSTKNIKPGNYFIRYISNNKNNNSVKKLVIK